jgi:hypothetical protein
VVRIGGAGPGGEGALLVYRTRGVGAVRLIISLNVRDLALGGIQPGEAVMAEDLAFHLQVLRDGGIHAHPTFMLYEQSTTIESWLKRLVEERRPDGLSTDRHGRLVELWQVELCAGLRAELEQVDVFTIADGHHRIEASRRVFQDGETHGWFLAALAGCDVGTVPAFNRIFEGGGPFCEELVLEALGECGRFCSAGVDEPLVAGQMALGMSGHWWRMDWNAGVRGDDTLEAELFESNLLPRLSRCVRGAQPASRFVSLSVSELARTLDSSPGTLAVAFPPISRALYHRRARRGELLPPKSVCFPDKPEFSTLT